MAEDEDGAEVAAEHSRTHDLDGQVACSCGLERRAGAVADESCFLLKLAIVRSGSTSLTVVHFEGLWAWWLSMVEPGDLLRVIAAEIPLPHDTERAWRVTQRSETVVVQRDDDQINIRRDMLRNVRDVPSWFSFPPWRVGGMYKYCNRLCTLRDGECANVWAVVWESAKPGAMLQPGGRLVMNVTIVDPSCEALHCHEWVTSSLLTQVSLQIEVRSPLSLPSELPFLGVGEVVRAHRIHIQRKGSRYVNLWHKKYSAVVRFGSGLGEVDGRSLDDRGATITENDLNHAQALRQWAYRRLSSETMSRYLISISELESRTGAHGDLVVEVVNVLRAERILVVCDGSTPVPVQVRVVEPPSSSCACDWLFSHVKPGQWLKLRAVAHIGAPDSSPIFGAEHEDNGSGASLRVNAAQVTLVPNWCYDVAARKPSASRITSAPAVGASVLADASSYREQTTLRVSSVAEEIPIERRPVVITSSTPEEGSLVQEAGAEPAMAMLSSTPGFSSVAAVGVANRTPQFVCDYVDVSVEGGGSLVSKSVHEARAAALSGPQCLILSRFVVVGISGPCNDLSTPGFGTVEDILCTECLACGCRFPIFNTDGHSDMFSRGQGSSVQDAKRRRRQLPCGHFTFICTLEGSFILRDQDKRSEILVAHFSDSNGSLFGVIPEEAANDPSVRRRIQEFIDALRAEGGRRVDNLHSLAVTTLPASATSDREFLLCDSRIVWRS